MIRQISLLAAAALVASVPVAAQAPAPPLAVNQWRVDGSHSSAGFSVRHLMVSTVRGQLGTMSGTVEYDGKDVRTIKVDVTIDVKAINDLASLPPREEVLAKLLYLINAPAQRLVTAIGGVGRNLAVVVDQGVKENKFQS